MRVLVACEYSGVVRNAFLDRGADAWSCDLLPSEDGSNRHIVGDARERAERHAMAYPGKRFLITTETQSVVVQTQVNWTDK